MPYPHGAAPIGSVDVISVDVISDIQGDLDDFGRARDFARRRWRKEITVPLSR